MELFKLLGTIAIENAEAKKALQETGQEGEKTQSKLSKAFGAIGKGAAVVGKGIAVGLAAGATAMTGLTVKALQLSGDLEQNMGGAEAVFGELGKTIGDMEAPMQRYDAATGKVITETASLEKISKDAYKNMGLSQSDYLATANKMGALFKGAGFETQEALNLSSEAMQRAADVASIMGIDTEAAMEAVAGAAKGNFTMMDNLGVAMNDTAIGAYALEKGIKKSTSEMSQQEKIGLAMEMFMEKTSYAAGNYAKENETLAGSLGTAKAALTNFLAGSGDVDSLVSSFSGLANVVIKSLGEIVPRLTTGLTDIVNQIAPMIPGLLNQLLPILIEGATSLVNGLVAALPGVLSALMAALPSLIEGVMSIVDGLIGALPQIMETIVSALPTLIPQLIDAVVSLIMMLVEMLPQIITPIIDALPTIIVAIADALISNLPVLIQGCVQLIGALAAALPQIVGALWEAIKGIFVLLGQKILGFFEPVKTAISNAWQAMGNVPGLSSMKTMIEQVWGAIKNYITTYINAIKNIVTTVWNSIKNVISTVLNSIKNVIQTAWNAVKTIISNVMKLISSVLKGDWEGVKSAISNILNAIKSVIQSVWNGIKSIISSVLNGIKSVVSSVWNGIKSVVTSYLNMIKTVISSVWNGIKGTISGVLSGIKNTVKSGFNDVKNNAINILKSIPGKVKSVGLDIVKGIGNGITNGIDWIKSKITSFVGNVTSFIKKLFKIKSPSQLMRDEVGREIARGVAVGIEENTSAATGAIKSLGEDVLATAKDTIAKEVADIQTEAAKKAAEAQSKTTKTTKKNAEKIAEIEADTQKKVAEANSKLNAEILKTAKTKLATYKQYNSMTAKSEVQFWDQIRQQFEEGTEERIEADQAYFEARNKIDEELLAAAEKRLDKYQTYNEMTLAEEVGFWDEIRQQCEEGTDARLEADKKYLDAKKNLNEQIASAEETLQSKLDGIYKKIEDRAKIIEGTFNLFDIAKSDEKLDDGQMFYALNSQVSALESYQKEMEELKGKIGDTALYSEIESMGVGALNQIKTLNEMSDYSLQYYLDMYNKKSELAKGIASSELQEETQAETEKAYKDYADRMAGLGVDIVEETEAMKINGVNNLKAMLEEFATALKDFTPKMKMPHFSIQGSLDLEAGTVPTVSVEWFKKAMNNAMVLDNPTIFGYNKGRFLGAGESGSEVVAGSSTLMNMIQGAVASQNSSLISYLQKIVEMLATFFPEQIETFRNMKLQLNTGALVGELVNPMDQALGKLSTRKDRGR